MCNVAENENKCFRANTLSFTIRIYNSVIIHTHIEKKPLVA